MSMRLVGLATVLAGAAILALSFGGTASANAGVERLQLGAPAAAPAGFLRFCITNPGACPRAEAPATLSEPATARRQPDWSLGPGWGAMWSAASFSLRDLDRGLRSEDDGGLALHTSAVRSRPDILAEHRPAVQAAPAADTAAAITQTADGSGEIALTDEARKLLHRINRDVNRHVRPRSDMQLHGRAEHWGFPVAINGTLYGDCEDYALEKKRRLIEAGVPAAALTLAVVHTRQREVHAVLMVATDQGDLVLDNRAARIRPWMRTSYHWIMRQVSGDSLKWAQIETPAAA